MNTYYLLTDVTTTDIIVAIVYGLLALIIGILFGYSINSKYRKKVVEFEQENVKLKSSVSNFEAQLEEAKKARSNADDEITLLRNRVRDRDIRIKETEGKMALISKRLEESQAHASELEAKKEIVLPSSKLTAPSPIQEVKEVKANVKPKVTAPKLKKVKKDKDVKKKAKSATKSKKSSSTSSTLTPTKSKKSATKTEAKDTGKKKRGRPAGSKNKTTSTVKKVAAKTATPIKAVTSVVAEPKRRGRPAGSKNKTTSTAEKVKATKTVAKPAAKRGRPAGSKNKAKVTPTTTRRRGRPAGSKNKVVAAASTGKRGRAKDDLTLIEGIGPKMEEALRNGGIKTFNKIAGTKPEKLKSILVKANTRFGIAATDSWPTQAKLAAKGAMEELKAYQDTLNRGR